MIVDDSLIHDKQFLQNKSSYPMHFEFILRRNSATNQYNIMENCLLVVKKIYRRDPYHEISLEQHFPFSILPLTSRYTYM